MSKLQATLRVDPQTPPPGARAPAVCALPSTARPLGTGQANEISEQVNLFPSNVYFRSLFGGWESTIHYVCVSFNPLSSFPQLQPVPSISTHDAGKKKRAQCLINLIITVKGDRYSIRETFSYKYSVHSYHELYGSVRSTVE